MKILVTGGAGFIGSALIRSLLEKPDVSVVNVDKLAYAGSRETIAAWTDNPRYTFVQQDICDAPAMRDLLREQRPELVMHLAAESHVDRSIDRPGDFIQSNIVGTYSLLEAALDYWRGLAEAQRKRFRFHHVSTDEVYGSLAHSAPAFTESTPYSPNSPYAASKASSDHLVRAWHETYGLPVVISNCTNNYGPYQFPEKLIPLAVLKAIAGEAIPVYGDGGNVRDWLYVEDHAAALYRIATAGRVGESYNVSGDCERANIDLVRCLCTLLDELRPGDPVVPHAQLITFVKDRPGHDLRYAMNAAKLRTELGWAPSVGFEDGMHRTVQWYTENLDWCEAVSSGNYAGERLGLRAGSG